MDGPEIGMNRTEYRDIAGNPRATGGEWSGGSNTVTHIDTSHQKSVEGAWRPSLESGAQDNWQPETVDYAPSGVRYFLERTKKNQPPRHLISNVTLAMGPKTRDNTYTETRGFTYNPAPEDTLVQHGRRQGHHRQGSAEDARDQQRLTHMNYAPTAHDHPGNVVTSLVTTGGDPLAHYTMPSEPTEVSQ